MPLHRLIPCTGAILIGGKSTRMGSPKHEILLADGQSMLDHVRSAMAPLCRQIVLLDSSAQPSNVNTTIHDLHPGAGPLGGIEALLASGLDPDGQYLVCPCDVPRITCEILGLLLQPSSAAATLLRRKGQSQPEPLPARASQSALPAVEAMMRQSIYALRELWPRVSPEIVDIDPQQSQCLLNVNTPGDLAATNHDAID